MADAGFFRGTSAEQDSRFSNKEKKLMKSMNFDPILDEKIDLDKIRQSQNPGLAKSGLDVLKPWIAERVTQLLGGFEDDIVIEYIFEQLQLDERQFNAKRMQINITGFLGAKKARIFMADLWKHLVSASNNSLGISQLLIDQEKEKAAAHQQPYSMPHVPRPVLSSPVARSSTVASGRCSSNWWRCELGTSTSTFSSRLWGQAKAFTVEHGGIVIKCSCIEPKRIVLQTR
eukprot:TRINITY_DN11834_c0_g1_i18.p4 TRINITY_DN11834_c0_g1~~TRINITY_DN11834_c0_g1_i18.p4  ORF type:complete len:230 (+),score=55.69 TRINITY_DN11834_c0_g1_i18:4404-5093(+)